MSKSHDSRSSVASTTINTTAHAHAGSHASHTAPPVDLIDAATSRGTEALARVQSQIDALDPAVVSAPNADVSNAADVALGAYPAIHALREKLAHLPGYDIAAVDRIEDYALAAKYLDATCTAETRPPEALPALVAEGTELRDKLFVSATSMARWGLIVGDNLDALNTGRAFKAVANDLIALAVRFDSATEEARAQSPITPVVLERARWLGEKISVILARREHDATVTSVAVDNRRRAFHLLDSAYTEARAGVGFVRRHEGDVDQIAPVLRQHASPAPRRAPEAPATTLPATPAIAPVQPAPAVPKTTFPNNSPFVDESELEPSGR